ncbi:MULTISPECIES: hypothetical protein [Bacillota]|uniref:hypothetical protein n=1 Tax=Bacillota TaxID=1239 RepID=UPI0025836846|nr:MULTISPECIES: hypothetical protein [Bacillota]
MENKYQVDLLVSNSHYISAAEKAWLIEMRKRNPDSYICKTKEDNQKLIQVFNVSNIISNNKLKTKISVDLAKQYFQNDDQYQLYVFLEQFFDDYFFDNYFKDNNLIKFINVVDELLSYIPKEIIQNEIINDGYRCQSSHYHAFISKLDKTVKDKVNIRFSKLEEKIDCSEFCSFNKNENLKQFVNEVVQIVQKLVLEKKIDFYSPHTRQEYLIIDRFASPEHRETQWLTMNIKCIFNIQYR